MMMTDTILAALVGLVVTAAVVLLLIVRSGRKIATTNRSLRINQQAWLQLDALAKELSKPNDQTTVQDLVVEGVALVLQKYGKPPVP